MRAGAFTEIRVIELLNRRFVPFYFNTGGPGLGRDAAAEAFVKDKMENPFAYAAAFAPDGRLLGTAGIYADKDKVFQFLVEMLEQHPEFAKPTKAERDVLQLSDGASLDSISKAAQLHEQLGDYDVAQSLYRKVIAQSEAMPMQTTAYRALARIARHQKDWDLLESVLQQAEKEEIENFACDAVMERTYARLDKKEYEETLKDLEAAIAAQPASTRMGELRFYAGVAAFFSKNENRAFYHWCWVVENIPSDPMQRRCYVAAAHKGMPYPNPELGGFASNHRGGNTRIMKSAYEEARKIYEEIKQQEQ